MLFAASNTILWDEDGNVIQHPHWFQFAKDRCFMAYRTTSTPCSCWLCKGERYNRAKSRRGRSKKQRKMILRFFEKFQGIPKNGTPFLHLCRKTLIIYAILLMVEQDYQKPGFVVQKFLLNCSTCFCIIVLTCSNETGVKLLLSTPTSYCVGKSIFNLGTSLPVLFLQVWTCPNSCQVSL